ncbi:hypothetical protein [Synechococcus elongatus]|uniref:SPOR domain-containing protein n=1 Tax=Synechococcus elongatus (strain ATCC 33912 / PCC 7942 / FACHB-805) TaxID=1140 RepID=Q31N31_SYNE7|nr:hypothetical protein [Synechococcus elongatus]ABB57538.1 conserved hypothetical protein [Synechococcus elongatus PCC 7942 = FACHB-805]AJD57886.1 hypothetical protein M744_08545 [Synechococcus elongatus UTEX 2973]MBD2588342.1 hypothetical protein [Synechococcus elongatus FACHB-242]MBD2689495.1 hypothetical protein [Synechococcus elongatus FACHB-1061]MBD2708086.1 hypothetical protein [Synechococcus elongatus PCC 7942 = FACHB-805]
MPVRSFLLLLSSLSSSLIPAASAIAQDILPPPPPTAVPSAPIPVQPAPPTVTPVVPAGTSVPVPTGGSVPSPSTGNYVVFVNSSSQALLDIMRTVDPSVGFLNFEGRTVITLGTFTGATEAKQRLQQFQALGITGFAKDTVDGRLIPSLELPSPFANTPQPIPTTYNRGYYLAIPSFGQDVPALTSVLTRFDLQGGQVQSRSLPLGNFVVVGPYAQSSQLNTVLQTLRKAGLQTVRIYFGG